MKIYATITAINTPSAGFYQARTCLGTVVNGVSLKGPKFPFSVGDQVAVFEVDKKFGSFGSMGGYISILNVPGNLRAGICKQAPAKASLWYIAMLAGNKTFYYSVGTVTSITGDKLGIAGAKANGLVAVDGVAADFTVGDEVLISHKNKSAIVAGWWNTVPSVNTTPALRIERLKSSATISMSEITEAGITRSVNASPNPLFEYVDSAFQTTLRTDNNDDYLYSYIHFFRNFGAAYEDRWVRWHKKNFTVEEITQAQYNALALIQPAYNLTADGKYFWWDNVLDVLQISDTVGGVRTDIIKVEHATGALDTAYFPYKDYVYGVTP